MMRITMLAPPDALTGIHRVAAAYAQRLAQRGHRVTVIQPGHSRRGLLPSVKHLAATGHWPRSADAGPSYFERWPLACAGGASGRAERRKLSHPGPIAADDVPDADLVLATSWQAAEWAWSLPPGRGHKVHLVQDYDIWTGDVNRVDAACQLPIPKIVSTRWVSNLLSSRFGQEPVALIPNSVDTAIFRAAPRGRQRIPTVGLTYSPSHNKGIDLAIAAVEKARRHLPELRLIAFGSANPSRQLPLPCNTEFFHRLPDRELPSLYASCDAWLFASRIQGFGLPLLEAMACRTPIIATPAGAAPDLLVHGGGVPVPMEDADAMADAIMQICLAPDRHWRAMSDAARQTATSYTWDDATDRLEAALEQIRTGTVACLPPAAAGHMSHSRPFLRDEVA